MANFGVTLVQKMLTYVLVCSAFLPFASLELRSFYPLPASHNGEFRRYACAKNAHIRFSMLRFFALRKP